ncbi:MAG: substrate-binding domain-containing protein [Chitinophagaceae bacterium]|jgi:phosphate transport system substrate-binding protein|nr:substrate-binding domain-containing protein [Chitinophagaceae bacterium]
MRYLYIMFSVCILATACKTSSTTEQIDTPSEGRIRISVEESFKPFIEQELKVFALSFPKASIEVAYKSEIECFKDLASDSTRMIIVTRGLDKKEQANYKEQLSYAPTFGILAYNAIAVVVNKKSKDSVFSMAELSAVLSGKNNKQVVMDGSNLTGIVRFLKDSLLHETPFGKNVVSANGSEEVISYIKENPNAIGFVGMNWVGDNYDPKQMEDRKSLKMALVECTLCIEKGYYSQPSQSNISKGHYSLSLPIYYILKENAPGLGTGLLNFMSLERGQLIFQRAFLVPAKMGFKKRKGLLN